MSCIPLAYHLRQKYSQKGSISYVFLLSRTRMLMGIFRTGFIAFSISPRNSIPAVLTLLSQTNASYLSFSSEEKIVSIVDTALINLPTGHRVTLHVMPTLRIYTHHQESTPFSSLNHQSRLNECGSTHILFFGYVELADGWIPNLFFLFKKKVYILYLLSGHQSDRLHSPVCTASSQTIAQCILAWLTDAMIKVLGNLT